MKLTFIRMHWGIIPALILLMGCSRTALEISNAPIISNSNSPLSVQQVGEKIIHAGTRLGWVMDSNKSGEIIGTFNKTSKYSITVYIPYTSNNYSILYRQSTGLKYKPDAIFYGKKIHWRYNRVLKRLDAAIKQEFINPSFTSPKKFTEEAPPAPPEKSEGEPRTMKDLEKWLREKERE